MATSSLVLGQPLRMTSGVPVPPDLNVVKAVGGKIVPNGDGKQNGDSLDAEREEVGERLLRGTAGSQNGKHRLQKLRGGLTGRLMSWLEQNRFGENVLLLRQSRGQSANSSFVVGQISRKMIVVSGLKATDVTNAVGRTLPNGDWMQCVVVDFGSSGASQNAKQVD